MTGGWRPGLTGSEHRDGSRSRGAARVFICGFVFAVVLVTVVGGRPHLSSARPVPTVSTPTLPTPTVPTVPTVTVPKVPVLPTATVPAVPAVTVPKAPS